MNAAVLNPGRERVRVQVDRAGDARQRRQHGHRQQAAEPGRSDVTA